MAAAGNTRVGPVIVSDSDWNQILTINGIEQPLHEWHAMSTAELDAVRLKDGKKVPLPESLSLLRMWSHKPVVEPGDLPDQIKVGNRLVLLTEWNAPVKIGEETRSLAVWHSMSAETLRTAIRGVALPLPLELIRVWPAEVANQYLSYLPSQAEKTVNLIDWGKILFKFIYESTNKALAELGIPVRLGPGEQDPILDHYEIGAVPEDVFVERLQQLWAENTGPKPATKPMKTEILKAFGLMLEGSLATKTQYLYERITYLTKVLQALKEKGDTATLFKLCSNTNYSHFITIVGEAQKQGVAPFLGMGEELAATPALHGITTSFALGARKGAGKAEAAAALIRNLCLLEGEIPGHINLIDDSASYCASIGLGCTEVMRILASFGRTDVTIEGKGRQVTDYGLADFAKEVEESLPEGTFPAGTFDERLASARLEATTIFEAQATAGRDVAHFAGPVAESPVAASAAASGGGSSHHPVAGAFSVSGVGSSGGGGSHETKVDTGPGVPAPVSG